MLYLYSLRGITVSGRLCFQSIHKHTLLWVISVFKFSTVSSVDFPSIGEFDVSNETFNRVQKIQKITITVGIVLDSSRRQMLKPIRYTPLVCLTLAVTRLIGVATGPARRSMVAAATFSVDGADHM